MKIIYQKEAGVLSISQKTYINRISKDAIGPIESNASSEAASSKASPSKTILKPRIPLNYIPIKEQEHIASTKAVKQYQSDIGSVNYANTVSRPDLALAVSMLSQFLVNPNEEHQKLATRLLAYTGGTSNYTLIYRANSNKSSNGVLEKSDENNLDLWGHVDASYASGADMKSRTGFVFFFAGAPISWKSQQQSSTTKSSAEAEYMALSAVGSEAIWL